MAEKTVLSALIQSILSQKKKGKEAEEEKEEKVAKRTIDTGDVETRAKEIILEAKDEALKIKKQAEDEVSEIRREALAIEARLVQKEEVIDQKLGELERREKAQEEKEKEISEKLTEQDAVREKLAAELEKVSGLTKKEAEARLLREVEENLKSEISRRVKEAEDYINQEADKRAQQIILASMQRGATDYVAEYTVTTIPLQQEDMKGRIIGKEGRNIRALEISTGVDIDLEEEGVIRLSSFDPIRREVAKIAIERLVKDGRIQPSRVEEFVERSRRDVDKIIYEAGLNLATEAGVHGLPSGLIALLGKFKFRTSFGQNQWLHTLEVVKIAISIAQQVRADVALTRQIALFHDIGKVADEEGPQEEVGANVLRRANVPEDVVAGVATQHTDEFSSIESAIVFVADAISAARPGARHEPHEEYVKRIADIESIAQSHEGVEKAYALEAGREVRVLVVPGEVDDETLPKLAHDIAEEVRKKVTVPGQIKVTTIRETRAQSTS